MSAKAFSVIHKVTGHEFPQFFANDHREAAHNVISKGISLDDVIIKEIPSPFGGEELEIMCKNDRATWEKITRHAEGIINAVCAMAQTCNGGNKIWHDDPDSVDHALYHASTDEQYPPEYRILTAAELFLYILRETPAGFKLGSRLELNRAIVLEGTTDENQ